MRGKRTALLLALALSGLAVVASGCGVSRTLDPVAAAATKTVNAGGVKVAMTIDASGDGHSVRIAANGSFDKDQGQLTLDLSGLTGGSAELRFLEENGDPVVYMNVPFLSGQMAGGKSWIRLDLQQAGQAAGVDVNQLLSQAGQNPADVLDLLRQSGSVQEVGTDTVGGEATTHYKATVDLEKAVDKLGPRAKDMVQHLIDAGAPSTLPVDVWVGDDGLVRKLTMDETFVAGGQSAGVDLSVVFSDYGTDVSVAAPPADQTLDLSGMLGALSGATTH